MSSQSDTGPLYKLTFFTPITALSQCKDAVFSAGAGAYPGGIYTQACFESRGVGQFLPMEGADPNIGKVGEVEKVEEMKVETICVGEQCARNAVQALRKAHPYEQAAVEVIRLENM